MPFWWLVRRLAAVVRRVLLPRWLCEGRLSHRLALLLTLLLLAVELLPATNPAKVEAHALYMAGAATLAGWFDATWRPRLAATAALGELAAELDRLYWVEADAGVLADAQRARAAQLEAEIARLRETLDNFTTSQPAGTFSMDRDGRLVAPSAVAGRWEQLARELAAAEAELAHVQRLLELANESYQQAQTLRLEAEVSRQRLEDYLALFNTASVYDAASTSLPDAANALEQELERRRRIAIERARVEAALSASPLE